MPLIIAGPIFPDNRVYFNKYIKPHLNEKIRYIGYIDRDKILTYFQQAKAMLMPIRWEEPFGRTIIESMACGTPIIAIGRGSVPEIVVDGKTGFVVKSVNEMIKAVGRLDTINRADCREHVVKNFSNQRMIDGYEDVFKKVLGIKN
jgi:glycosyltransferase involved in cell wall biosynthesis